MVKCKRLKLLIISGSPRPGGNTEDCAEFLAGCLKGYEGVIAEHLRLRDRDIRPCTGCRKCMQLMRCAVAGDDMPALLEKIASCEGLVLAAPVYWDAPPGMMKDFIDRTHGLYARPQPYAGKKGWLVSVATESGFATHERVLSGWFSHYGAEILRKVRIFACEKGDAMASASARDTLQALAGEIALAS